MADINVSNTSTLAGSSLATLAALAKQDSDASHFGGVMGLLVTTLRLLPWLLYCLITFATITLPTWLFMLASMSLTFTLNATTLCVHVLHLTPS